MNLATLLLPAVGGYWFVTHFNLTRYEALRESGYHILFRSVLVGIFWYCVAAAAVWFLDACDIGRFPEVIKWWNKLFPQPLTFETVMAIALGGLSPYVLNGFCSEYVGTRRAAARAGDEIELLISDTLRTQSPIEISLRSRRVYIGFVMGNATRQSGMPVPLLPCYSGHRSESDLNLVIDIDYNYTLERFFEGEGGDLDDFRVMIPIGEIVSVRQFHLDVYRAFQDDFAAVENREQD